MAAAARQRWRRGAVGNQQAAEHAFVQLRRLGQRHLDEERAAGGLGLGHLFVDRPLEVPVERVDVDLVAVADLDADRQIFHYRHVEP